MVNSIPVQRISRSILTDLKWNLYRTQSEEVDCPQKLEPQFLFQENAQVPGTVSSTINAIDSDNWAPAFDYDDFDWWYSAEFSSPLDAELQSISLVLKGLATFCEVWLNDKCLTRTDNMFREYSLDISNDLSKVNKLTLRFCSLNRKLNEKRPRPRWKTRLVENQQMRWIRATVLGHVDVWTPPIKPIGPWKSIDFLANYQAKLENLNVHPFVEEEHNFLKVSGSLNALEVSEPIEKIVLKINEQSFSIFFSPTKDNIEFDQTIQIGELAHWWPHTHGEPTLHDYQLFALSKSNKWELKTGKIGFKKTEFISSKSSTAIFINGKKIFCRGACWTVSDYRTLNAPKETIRRQLELLKNSGANMVRVGGTMVYESDEFYGLCDELGLLVWQDFMFASMDYPIEDSEFSTNVLAEIDCQIRRLSKHVSIATYCGNTDIQAQAAMYGMPKEIWSNPLFNEWIPNTIKKYSASIPYVNSSPQDGVMPFYLDQGVSHFWGVGAYMHPLANSCASTVHFSSEGMGLSHIPEDKTITDCIGKQTLFPYHKQWNDRVPRDLGAGWDFDDIRNFYLNELFNVDPVELKRSNVNRYIELSRIVTGEMIASVFKVWRKANSNCNGGLVWFYRDFWPCAGFGLIDSENMPKAALYQLKQVWKSQQVIISNEGLNGCNISVINESNSVLKGRLDIRLIKYPNSIISDSNLPIQIEPNSNKSVSVEEQVGYFIDSGQSYRFGPPQFSLIVAQLYDDQDVLVSQDVEFNSDFNLPLLEQTEITTNLIELSENKLLLTVEASHFLQYVKLNVANFEPRENYFHILPGEKREVVLDRVIESEKKIKGELNALNLSNPLKFKLAR